MLYCIPSTEFWTHIHELSFEEGVDAYATVCASRALNRSFLWRRRSNSDVFAPDREALHTGRGAAPWFLRHPQWSVDTCAGALESGAEGEQGSEEQSA